jgi:hypothetical protein
VGGKPPAGRDVDRRLDLERDRRDRRSASAATQEVFKRRVIHERRAEGRSAREHPALAGRRGAVREDRLDAAEHVLKPVGPGPFLVQRLELALEIRDRAILRVREVAVLFLRLRDDRAELVMRLPHLVLNRLDHGPGPPGLGGLHDRGPSRERLFQRPDFLLSGARPDRGRRGARGVGVLPRPVGRFASRSAPRFGPICGPCPGSPKVERRPVRS